MFQFILDVLGKSRRAEKALLLECWAIEWRNDCLEEGYIDSNLREDFWEIVGGS